MQEFTNTLKLYGFKNENRVSLSILSSPSHVLTFYIQGDQFEQILDEYATSRGAEISPYFVHLKGSYVRFTHRAPGVETNLRVPSVKWQALIEDYRKKSSMTEGPLITCIVP